MTATTTPRSAAGWAAGGYLAIFVVAIFANFLALTPVLQPGDAPGTAAARQESETSSSRGRSGCSSDRSTATCRYWRHGSA